MNILFLFNIFLWIWNGYNIDLRIFGFKIRLQNEHKWKCHRIDDGFVVFMTLWRHQRYGDNLNQTMLNTFLLHCTRQSNMLKIYLLRHCNSATISFLCSPPFQLFAILWRASLKQKTILQYILFLIIFKWLFFLFYPKKTASSWRCFINYFEKKTSQFEVDAIDLLFRLKLNRSKWTLFT